MTPSSAATTITAMSVTLAPRARIEVNASWPGVSRKTTRLPSLVVTSDAPMCWVMPPRSPAATVVERIASSRLVLPWSTWPMTVTIGARGTRSFSSSASVPELLLGGLGRRPAALVVVGRGGGRVRLGDLVAELLGDERRGVAVDQLVDRREDAALDELADDVRRVDVEQVRELLDGDRRRQLDRAALRRIDDGDAARREAARTTRRLAGSSTAAGAAPTPGHGLLLGASCRVWGRVASRRPAGVVWSWRRGRRGRRDQDRRRSVGIASPSACSRALFRPARSKQAASRQR